MQEAVELMVAGIYTDAGAEEEDEERSNRSRMGGALGRPPSTVVAGFLKFLRLLSMHDWARYVVAMMLIGGSVCRSRDRVCLTVQLEPLSIFIILGSLSS